MAGVKDQGSGTYYAGGAANDDTNRMKYAAHFWEHTDSITVYSQHSLAWARRARIRARSGGAIRVGQLTTMAMC